jgi:hypothetical protein
MFLLRRRWDERRGVASSYVAEWDAVGVEALDGCGAAAERILALLDGRVAIGKLRVIVQATTANLDGIAGFAADGREEAAAAERGQDGGCNGDICAGYKAGHVAGSDTPG